MCHMQTMPGMYVLDVRVGTGVGGGVRTPLFKIQSELEIIYAR